MWAHARKGQHGPAKAVFDRMVAAGITPDDRHHKALEWASGETKRRLDDRPRAATRPPW
jgi:pentatricopeptide repeat protein